MHVAQSTPVAVPPCARCGDSGGYVPQSMVRPRRIRAAWEVDGVVHIGRVCGGCYQKSARERRPPSRPTGRGLNGLTPKERDEATDNAKAIRAKALAALQRPEANRDIPVLRGRVRLDVVSSPALDDLSDADVCRILRRRTRAVFRFTPKPLRESEHV